MLLANNCHHLLGFDLFVGAEWDYVLVSTVHSLPKNIIPNVKPNQQWLSNNLGRIINAGEINVAITRARKGMIIFGELNV